MPPCRSPRLSRHPQPPRPSSICTWCVCVITPTRRLPYGGAVEEEGGLLLGVRSRGSGRAREPPAHANASASELPARGAGFAGENGEEVGGGGGESLPIRSCCYTVPALGQAFGDFLEKSPTVVQQAAWKKRNFSRVVQKGDQACYIFSFEKPQRRGGVRYDGTATPP